MMASHWAVLGWRHEQDGVDFSSNSIQSMSQPYPPQVLGLGIDGIKRQTKRIGSHRDLVNTLGPSPIATLLGLHGEIEHGGGHINFVGPMSSIAYPVLPLCRVRALKPTAEARSPG
jgi:hypothetical protein